MTNLDDEAANYKKEYPKRNVAMVGLINEDGKILLTRTNKLPQSWHNVGGGIEPGDKTPDDTVIREVEEELGVELDPENLKHVITTPYDFGEGEIHNYKAFLSKHTELNVNKHEIIEHKWFDINEAKQLPIYPALRTFLSELQKS